MRNIVPPEDITPLREEHHAAVEKSSSAYIQARDYIDRFKKWHSGVKVMPDSLDVYERNLSFKMTLNEWIKVSNDLNYAEIDEKFKFLSRLFKMHC